MSTDRPRWTPTETTAHHVCQNCGTKVSARLTRVYGDNSDTLWHCTDCDVPDICPRDLRNGAGMNPDYDPLVDRVRSTRSGHYPMDSGGDDDE